MFETDLVLCRMLLMRVKVLAGWNDQQVVISFLRVLGAMFMIQTIYL